MTTPLSPAAQAVLDAYVNAPCGKPRSVWVAAAIRAAADQVVPEPPNCGTPANDYVRGLEDRQRMARFRLLCIAAELEGADA